MVRDASLGLFQGFLEENDQAAFLVFNHQLEVVVPFTGDVDWLSDGTAALKAFGGTALYDSIVNSLYYLGGTRSRKALILLSDGHDESSRLSSNEALEYARRAGVVVYPVVLQRSERADRPGHPTMFDSMRDHKETLNQARSRRFLKQLAEQTGGLIQFASIRSELPAMLDVIATDLRHQYRLTYQSHLTHADGSFREVTVRSNKGGAIVRTIAGYYANYSGE